LSVEPNQRQHVPVLFQKWKFSRAQSYSPVILIAEDNLEMQQYLETILSPYYCLHFVSNGLEAMTYLKENPQPDLLITDLMMPEMSGYQLIERIKQTEAYRFIPILILTARSDRSRIYSMTDDYLVKPFEEAALIVECAGSD
jgi:CheY-like chemotaxis protein